MAKVRLTTAQALVRFLAAQRNADSQPIFAGVWAIFGHGNVAGLGEALHAAGDALPTFRGQNEQSMALAAIAYAKASGRHRMMACTTSIGPGATNMVTAAAVAHVNRLPVLLLPGDVFANRAPDPVLQQVEDFAEGTVSANDCFRPVSRYFDRIARPEHLLTALPRAMAVLTDPANCGPVTLALCQDTQAEAYDYPESFFAERVWRVRRPLPDRAELAEAVAALRAAKAPLIVAGGGVHYSGACAALAAFATAHGIRLADFTTGSWAAFGNPNRVLVGLNVQPFDAGKHLARPLVADALEGLASLHAELGNHAAPAAWTAACQGRLPAWRDAVTAITAPGNATPTDAQVIGAVQAWARDDTVIVAAAGGLPGELHKLWQAGRPGSYHLEYGYSTMGYEIAGGLGVKLALPTREVVVMLGDGSWLMANAELFTSVMLGLKLIVVLLDNGGFGCIERLQRGTGGASFNNLLVTARHNTLPVLDFVAQAAGLGAIALHADTLASFSAALATARTADRSTVIVLQTDPAASTEAGGHWWDVAVPEVSARAEVRAARTQYDEQRRAQRLGD